MKLDGMFIAGVGAYVPDSVSTEEAVAAGWYDADEAAASGWTGAAVAGDLPAPDMAVIAARQALARSGHEPGEVAIVLHGSSIGFQGPDVWPVQSYIQRRTIGGEEPALEVRQACNATLAAMELASAYLGSAAQPAAMITAADNFGHAQFDRWRYAAGAGNNRLTIVGDAGCSVILSKRQGFARLLAINSRSVPDLEEMYRSGVDLFPPEPTLGGPCRPGQRWAHYRGQHPEAFEAAKLMLSEARATLGKRTLSDAGVTPEQITRAAHVFAGGQRYITSVLAPIGIDPARGMLEFGRGVGHLAACDQIVALDHLLTTHAVGPGDHVMLLSNGGGSLMCAILEILTVPSWIA
jgi:3-oxoacyl-[acyl-carrier-protein] synthase-3